MAAADHSGCLVILEPGAEWPTPVFQRMGERDHVIVMTREPGEPLAPFLARLDRRLKLAARSAFSLRTVVVACSGNANGALEARLRLLRRVAQAVDRDREVRFVIVGDAADGVESTVLLVMADALLEHLRGERVTIQIVSTGTPPSESRRSGHTWRSAPTSALPRTA